MAEWWRERVVEGSIVSHIQKCRNLWYATLKVAVQHGFASLSHMRSVIDNWRDDYNPSRRGSPGG